MLTLHVARQKTEYGGLVRAACLYEFRSLLSVSSYTYNGI